LRVRVRVRVRVLVRMAGISSGSPVIPGMWSC
jgi:hypothetical protein